MVHNSPFADLSKLPDCKSFEMNKRATTQTIRTFLKPELPGISRPDEINSVLANKLQGQLSQNAPNTGPNSNYAENPDYMDNINKVNEVLTNDSYLEKNPLMRESRRSTSKSAAKNS